MPSYAEAIADVMYKSFCRVVDSFFANALPRQTEKFRICLSILLPRHLAPEFRRVNHIGKAEGLPVC